MVALGIVKVEKECEMHVTKLTIKCNISVKSCHPVNLPPQTDPNFINTAPSPLFPIAVKLLIIGLINIKNKNTWIKCRDNPKLVGINFDSFSLDFESKDDQTNKLTILIVVTELSILFRLYQFCSFNNQTTVITN